MSNKNKTVDAFLAKKKHPLTKEIEKVRSIILATDKRVTEEIKWSTPTFIYKGNIASFFLNAKKQVSLMFHYGASIKDTSGLLEGDAKVGRVARFADMKDIAKKKSALQKVIREWIRMQDKKIPD